MKKNKIIKAFEKIVQIYKTFRNNLSLKLIENFSTFNLLNKMFINTIFLVFLCSFYCYCNKVEHKNKEQIKKSF